MVYGTLVLQMISLYQQSYTEDVFYCTPFLSNPDCSSAKIPSAFPLIRF